jgi:RHS repeat-associated protein
MSGTASAPDANSSSTTRRARRRWRVPALVGACAALLCGASALGAGGDISVMRTYTTTVNDTSCATCTVTVANNVTTATVAQGADTSDTAYARRDFGGTAGWDGMVYLRTNISVPNGQAMSGDLFITELRDTQDRLALTVWLRTQDSTIRIDSPAGGLRGTAIAANTTIAVPNTGVSRRLEIAALRNNSLTVRVDGTQRVSMTGFTGATTSNPRYLNAGIITRAGTNTAAKTVIQSNIGATTSGWLDTRDGPSSPITYVHDDAGRLTAVVDPDQGAARYHYDPAGNLLQITRPSHTATSILEHSPKKGSAGTQVTVYGTAFSTTPAQNTVTFNGTAATVVSSTKSTIVATVPAAATTGAIAVTSPSGSATSTVPFTVGTNAPTISSVSAPIAAADDTLTITGTNFQASDKLLNNVTINGTFAEVTASTATQLTVKVPPETAGGPVEVETPDGLAQGPDLFIPTNSSGQYTVAQIAVRQRITIGPAAAVTQTSTTGQAALVLFSGTRGQRVSIRASAGPYQAAYLHAPNGTILGPVNGTGIGAGGFIDTVTLPDTGSYTMLLTGAVGFSGSTTLQVYDVPADISGAIVAGGSAVTLTTTAPGQKARYTFQGTQGQRVSLAVTNNTLVATPGLPSVPPAVFVSIRKPSGLDLVAPTGVGTSGFIDAVTLPVTGTYTVFAGPEAWATGSATLQLYTVPADLVGSLAPGGASSTLTTTVPGQNARWTLAGTAGQKVSIKTTGIAGTMSYYLQLRDSNGTLVGNAYFAWAPNGFMDTVTLPATGTYQLSFDPAGSWFGSVTAQAYLAPNVTAAHTLGGAPTTLNIAYPGQDGEVTVDAASGQVVTFTVSTNLSGQIGWSFLAVADLFNPQGSAFDGGTMQAVHTRTFGPHTLSSTGTFRIAINPVTDYVGPVTVSTSVSAPLGPQSLTTSGATSMSRAVASKLRPTGTAVRAKPLPGRRSIRTATPGRGNLVLAGKVRSVAGKPMAKVTLRVGTLRTRTDRKGRFVLRGLAPGHHTLVIDGRTANTGTTTFGVFDAGVTLENTLYTALPYTIYLRRLDAKGIVSIPKKMKRATVVRSREIPGLELHLPKGASVVDRNGKPVTRVSISKIPVTRTPFPLPKNVRVPVYFTIQPGGAHVVGGKARLIYPNYRYQRPGTQIAFWHYEPDEDWYVYGYGKATRDGRFVPDAGVGINSFTGAMAYSTEPIPPNGPLPFGPRDGDPVDLAKGMFTSQTSDLVLPGPMPIALTRMIGTAGGTFSNMRDAFDIRAVSDPGGLDEGNLIFADGGRVRFTRVPGTEIAEYEPAVPAAGMQGARLVRLPVTALVELRLPDGGLWTFDAYGYLSTMRDRFGNETKIFRRQPPLGNRVGGLISAIRSSSGRWIRLTYNSCNQVALAKDNTGRSVSYSYIGAPSCGALETVSNPEGGVTRYSYDGSSRVIGIRDARGIDFLTNHYNAQGRVDLQTQADGTTYQFAYTTDGTGKVTQTDVTSPRGIVRRVTFDAQGYPLTDTAAFGTPLAQTTTYVRPAAGGLPTRITDHAGRHTDLTYDAVGQPQSVTWPAGTPDAISNTVTYDPAKFNLPTETRDPLNRATQIAYDARGAVDAVTDPRGKVWDYQTNLDGQPTRIVDPLTNATQVTYRNGMQREITDPQGKVTRRFTDALGRVRATTDPAGRIVKADYNGFGSPTKTTDPSGASVNFGRNENGSATSVTDARGKQTSFTYDPMDRVSTRKDPLLREETTAYDGDGNPILRTDRNGKKTRYRYDALGRVTFVGFHEQGAPGSETYESSINYGYDTTGRLQTISDTWNGQITLGYDGRDRVNSVETPQGTIGYAYDAAGQRSSMTLAGQPLTTYGYSATGILTSVTRGTLSSTAAIDDAGRTSSWTLPNGVSMGYAYNAASRPTDVIYRQGSSEIGRVTYGYDAGGLRISTSGSWSKTLLPQVLTAGTFDDANRLTTRGATSFVHDLSGNLTSDGTRNYAWNARGELTGVSGATAASYAYDALGRRHESTVAGVTTSYLNDNANPVQETSAGQTATLLSGLAMDSFFARTTSAGISTHFTDVLGSTLTLAGSTGTVQTEYAYEPFGAMAQAGVASGNRQTFSGRDQDATGLQYTRARYYSPGMGKFISEDPIGFAGGDVNLYAYAGNSPLNMTDPSGLCGWTDPLGCVSGIGNSIRKSDYNPVNYCWSCVEPDDVLRTLGDCGQGAVPGFIVGSPGLFFGAVGGALAGCGGGMAAGAVDDQVGCLAAGGLNGAITKLPAAGRVTAGAAACIGVVLSPADGQGEADADCAAGAVEGGLPFIGGRPGWKLPVGAIAGCGATAW